MQKVGGLVSFGTEFCYICNELCACCSCCICVVFGIDGCGIVSRGKRKDASVVGCLLSVSVLSSSIPSQSSSVAGWRVVRCCNKRVSCLDRYRKEECHVIIISISMREERDFLRAGEVVYTRCIDEQLH